LDTRYDFVQELIEDGFLNIEFFRSAENDSDLFSKNVSQELHEIQMKKFLDDSGD
jgi:hypothetical protein